LKKLLNISSLSKVFFLAFLLAASCTSKRETTDFELIKDDLGREVKVKKKIKRVMALSSSLTEMLYVVCDQDQIIARTQNCDYPPQVLKKPIVSNYPIDFEKLLMLKPDLVLAKDGIVSMEAASKIEEMGIPIYFQHYGKVEDIFLGLEKLGVILDKKDRALRVADSLRTQLGKIEKSVAGLPKPSVLLIISKEQIFVYGKDTYASDMLNKAGGRNAVDSIFAHSFPLVNSEYILHLNPDIIIGETQVDLAGSFFTMYPELKKTNAFKNKKIYTVPEELISRPGPRVIEAIELLKKITHPDAK
jgi:iron complex transport system substrate-binding protein